MSTTAAAKLDYRNKGRKWLGQRLIEMEVITQRLQEDLDKFRALGGLEQLRELVRGHNKKYEQLEANYNMVIKQLNAIPKSVREQS